MAIDGARLDALVAELTQAGLAGASEDDLLARFCAEMRAAGTPIVRALAAVDTLHPIHEGRAFRWQAGQDAPNVVEYGRTTGDAEARWQATPFYHALEAGLSLLHLPITPESEARFPLLTELREVGMTDYLVVLNRLADGVIGGFDCIYTSWATDDAGGFAAPHIAALERLVPVLALAIKSASLGRIARTLVETYLGRDAGRRVLAGRIERGVAEPIGAVIWFSDLQGFTRITDSAPPEAIIPLLNDYADAVISAIHDRGGEVLKLIGDGVLAIFRADDAERGCNAALDAAAEARQRIAMLNEKRIVDGEAVTTLYLGLHIGEVFYGNVGSAERLDFTVVGPAVNETSRIAAMCRSVDQPILMSAAFVEAARQARRFVSVGRYALRGVGRAQDLYTLDPGSAA
jgi:adenylate cyclase